MSDINNLSEAEAVLAKYVPAVREVTGKDITLERMKPMMDALGNPQNKLRIIHIAGTSGKTSTAYYIANLLQQQGYKTGLTISPHIDSVTERVQINGQPLGEVEFCQALSQFLRIIDDVQPQPTYFELLVAFAYWYFAKEKVDYMVAETGLGGLHDATNIAGRADKTCVITDIGIDHTNILGDTIQKIAVQKAGIIHKGNPVFMYGQSDTVVDVFKNASDEQQATLNLLSMPELHSKYGSAELESLPKYQQRNWLLAREVCEFVANNDGFKITDDAQRSSMQVQVPGRMDVVRIDDKTLVLDGAHNEQKMTAFVESFRQKYPDQKAAVMLSLKQGKEYKDVLPLLKPITSHIVLTTFDAVQDLPIGSMNLDVLASAVESEGFDNVQIAPESRAAYDALLASGQELLIVTGSFYLVALVRSYIK